MRFSLSLYCLAAVVIAVHTTNSEELNYNSNNRHQQQDHILEPINLDADRETIAYFLPRLASKYRPSGEWSDVADPRFYLLTEMNKATYDDQEKTDNVRSKRQNLDRIFPSRMRYSPPKRTFSINAPINSLQDLYKQNQLKQQIQRNRALLQSF